MKKRKKIVFASSTPMNYIMFKPIADRMLADDRIDVWFTAKHSPKKNFQNGKITYHYEECVFRTSIQSTPIHVLAGKDLAWIEIDTAEDLQKAYELIYPLIKDKSQQK